MYSKRSIVAYSGLPPIPGLDERKASGLFHIWVQPSVQIILTSSYMKFRQYLPEGPEKLRLYENWAFPKSTVERPDFNDIVGPEYYEKYSQIVKEDLGINPIVQRAMRSGAYRPGRYSLEEYIVHRIANRVLDRVIGPDSEASRLEREDPPPGKPPEGNGSSDAPAIHRAQPAARPCRECALAHARVPGAAGPVRASARAPSRRRQLAFARALAGTRRTGSENAKTAHAIITYRFPKETLAADAPNLRFLQILGAGVDYLLPLDWVPTGVRMLTNSGAHVPKAAQSGPHGASDAQRAHAGARLEPPREEVESRLHRHARGQDAADRRRRRDRRAVSRSTPSASA